jgi:hypothetical protein
MTPPKPLLDALACWGFGEAEPYVACGCPQLHWSHVAAPRGHVIYEPGHVYAYYATWPPGSPGVKSWIMTNDLGEFLDAMKCVFG